MLECCKINLLKMSNYVGWLFLSFVNDFFFFAFLALRLLSGLGELHYLGSVSIFDFPSSILTCISQ